MGVDSDSESFYATYCAPVVEDQPAPEAPTDVPIVVPSPKVDQAKTCCPGCEELDLSQVPLIPVETPMKNPFVVEELTAVVRGQRARRGKGRANSRRYGGVPLMQPLGGKQYPSREERESERVGRFAKTRSPSVEYTVAKRERSPSHCSCGPSSKRPATSLRCIHYGRSELSSMDGWGFD